MILSECTICKLYEISDSLILIKLIDMPFHKDMFLETCMELIINYVQFLPFNCFRKSEVRSESKMFKYFLSLKNKRKEFQMLFLFRKEIFHFFVLDKICL